MSRPGQKLPPFSCLAAQLEPFLLEAVENCGFERMTPVQASSIPLFLQNKDVVVEAVTGSGKTLSYAIPVIQKLCSQAGHLKQREVGAIVILPTRELAVQVHKVFTDLLAAQPSTSSAPGIPPPLLLTGGARSTADDVTEFLETNAKIFIGTPGRLEEFLLGSSSLSNPHQPPQRHIKVMASVKNLDMLVLDEADRLLDLGFAPSLTRMLSALPKQKRTGLFSATMTDALRDIVRLGLRNPVRVVVKVEAKGGSLRTPSTLKNQYIVCKPEQKLYELLRLLNHLSQGDADPSTKFIVYFSTGAAVDYFYKLLDSYPALKDFSVHSLHGHQSAARRSAVYKSFTTQPASQLAILLCTDVAARGLDIPSVDCVIQFDPPTDPKTFSHRCGRTARAGQDGRAVVMLIEGREEDYIEFLQLRKVFLSKLDLPAEDDAAKRQKQLFHHLRQVVLTDRDLEEKGAKSFVSFVRAYTKHEASFIFRLADLNLPKLAEAFALLRLPRMPELKGSDTSTWEDAAVDWDNYAFADAAKEASRRKIQGEQKVKDKQSLKRSRPPRTEAWTDQKKAKQAKLEKHQQRVKSLQAQLPDEQTTPVQKGTQVVDAAELEEIRADEREARKARKTAPGAHAAVQGTFDADAF